MSFLWLHTKSTSIKQIRPEPADKHETYQKHGFEIVKFTKEFLCRDFSWVKDEVLSEICVLLLHVFVQQIQFFMLLSGSTHKAVETC